MCIRDSSNLSNVNEGGTFRITLATTNVTAGTQLNYTVTGIDANDLTTGSLTGTFVVGTTDFFDFTLAEDTTTEGVESFNIALDNGEAQAQVIIADTSQAAAVPSYALSTSSSSVNEGGAFTITLTTTNVANGTSLPYTITGIQSADIGGGALTGDFIVGSQESRVFNLSLIHI